MSYKYKIKCAQDERDISYINSQLWFCYVIRLNTVNMVSAPSFLKRMVLRSRTSRTYAALYIPQMWSQSYVVTQGSWTQYQLSTWSQGM